jgi:hypothetical protein
VPSRIAQASPQLTFVDATATPVAGEEADCTASDHHRTMREVTNSTPDAKGSEKASD